MATWADLDVFGTGNILSKDEVELIRTNLDFLRNPPRYFYERGFSDGDYTETSTTLALIDGTNLSTTLYTYGNNVRIKFMCSVQTSASAGRISFEILVDGAPISNDTTDGCGLITCAAANQSYLMHLERVATGLAEGNHTFSLQWKINTGTATMPDNNLIQFEVFEEN